MAGRVDVVIPTKNRWELVERAVTALRPESPAVRSVIVVDDGSVAPAPTFASQPFPLQLVTTAGVGFAGAVNSALERVSAEFVLVLNNDVRVTEGMLEPLVARLDGDSRLGSVMPLVLTADDPDVIDTAGIALERMLYPTDLLRGRPRTAVTEPRRIFGVSACTALYRTAALSALGGFCDDFYMYLEDVDLAWQLRTNGWEALVDPHVTAIHLGSATAGRGSRLKNFQMARNRWLLWARHLPRRYVAARLWYVLPYETILVVAQLLADRNVAGVRGRFAGIRMWWREAGPRPAPPDDPAFAPEPGDVRRRLVRRFLWHA